MEEVGVVCLRGGMSRSVAVRTQVDRQFAQPASEELAVDSAVARGAALLAASRLGQVNAIEVFEGCHDARLSLSARGAVAGGSTLPPRAGLRSEPGSRTYSVTPSDVSTRPPSSRLAARSDISVRTPSIPKQARVPKMEIDDPPDTIAPAESGTRRSSISASGDSLPPSSARASRAPLSGNSAFQGGLSSPASAAEMLDLRLVGPARFSGDSIPLPLLLARVLPYAHITGTLTIRRPGATATLWVQEGRGYLSSRERLTLQSAYDWNDAHFQFVPECEDNTARERIPLLHLAGDLIKSWTALLDSSAVVEAFGDKLALSPPLVPKMRNRVRNLHLSDREKRVLKFSMDGTLALRALISGSGGRAVLHVVLLLELFGMLEWSAVGRQIADPEAELATWMNRVEHANYFDVLGLHWSAQGDAIQAAFDRSMARVSTSRAVSPQIAAKLETALRDAYSVLQDPRQRASYRRRAFPKKDFAAMDELLDQRARALSMRKDEVSQKELTDTRALRGEISGRVKCSIGSKA